MERLKMKMNIITMTVTEYRQTDRQTNKQTNKQTNNHPSAHPLTPKHTQTQPDTPIHHWVRAGVRVGVCGDANTTPDQHVFLDVGDSQRNPTQNFGESQSHQISVEFKN